MVQDTGNRLLTAFQKQLDKVDYFCNAENISPNLAVHEIRKIFKRMRALLKFYSTSSNPFFAELKNKVLTHGRLLSVLRESAVNIQIFERIASANNLIPERKIKQIKDWLAENNRLMIKHELYDKQTCGSILEFSKQAEEQIHLFKSEQPSKATFVEFLHIEYEKSFVLFRTIETEMDAELMHSLRKKLKALWYQFEFLKYVHPRFFKLKTDQLNSITEQLGEDHDLYVFMSTLQASQTILAKDEDTILVNHIQHLREINYLKVSARLKQFFSEPPEQFQQKIQGIFKI